MLWRLTEEHKRKLHEGLRRWLPTTRGKKKKHRATIKQIKALQYMNQGMSKRKAMIKAGYAVPTAQQPGRKFFSRQGVKQMILDMGTELVDQGLTTKYMALKFKQWMETETGGKPDTRVQIEAYREWKKVMDQREEAKSGLRMKRKLTIEEFVMDRQKKETSEDIQPDA